MTTSQLLDQHAPELMYSVAAGCADVWWPRQLDGQETRTTLMNGF